MSSRFRYLVLSLVAGLLMWLSWPTSPGTVFIFIGLTPLLWLTEQVRNKTAYWGYVLLAFTIFNVGTTWWVGNTTVPASGVFANIFTALLMSIPFSSYYGTRKRFGRTAAYAALIVYWMTFEYVNLTWEFSWPWLSLGNVFAMHPNWVQWYEFTGVGGGTLWVLLVNIFVYEIYRAVIAQPIENITHIFRKSLIKKAVWVCTFLFVLPFIFTILALITSPVESLMTHPPLKVEVVVIQPNIDPYDKFSEGADAQQLESFLQLTRQKVDSNTKYIIWPETALFTQGAWEHELPYNTEVKHIRQFLQQYAPNAVLISGATTLKRYRPEDTNIPYTARMSDNGPYDAFNASVQIDTATNGPVEVYHKYELVPGVEMIPYVHYLSFMSTFALDMGGISGSYGRTPGVLLMSRQINDRKKVAMEFKHMMVTDSPTVNVGPAVCYESVYGEYMAKQVREGANFSVIMTNDGWWGDTEGHRQHLQYARLRAIETRRWIARSANTGISAFINPTGEVIDPQPYWKQAVIKQSVTLGYYKTFYVEYGDYLYKAAAFFCILLIIYRTYLRFAKRPNYVEGNQPGSV